MSERREKKSIEQLIAVEEKDDRLRRKRIAELIASGENPDVVPPPRFPADGEGLMSGWMDDAKKWRFVHSDHVAKLMNGTRASYPPSGSDCHHPELWKAAHWNWLFRAPPAPNSELDEAVKRLESFAITQTDTDRDIRVLIAALKDNGE